MDGAFVQGLRCYESLQEDGLNFTVVDIEL